jgi:hypothetical protein
VREPVASVTVTYISYNRRLDTYEKRVWEMSQEIMLERLADLFEEVGWPRNDGEGWFSSELPEKFKNLRENHGKEKD